MGQALGSDFIGSQTGHSRLLELELEQCYCCGAWYACIIISCSAVESFISNIVGKQGKEAKFLSEYKLRNEWLWLTNRRKYIVHPSEKSPGNNDDYDDVVNYNFVRPHLQKEAERAILLALKVILLGTNVKLPTSLEKPHNNQNQQDA
ncbi:hypothetical protein [Marinobacter sp.]|uniref:hypothetical protein n=1 Tax=Marinobacter sp. TaxID=50741 RepID=UPI003B521170